MQTLDVIFIIAAAFFVFIGVRRGFIGELFRIVALIAGFFVSFLYYREIAAHLHFASPVAVSAIAFVVLFLAVAIAVITVGWLIKKVVHLTPLGWVDGILGGAIGLTKTILIFWIVCLSVAAFPGGRPKFDAKKSIVYRTYTKLPRAMKLEGLSSLRDRIRKKAGTNLPQSIKHASERVESLKKRVDEFEKNESGKR
jgi:membrane protein required for colicin V production